jgi:hypothetical protein
VETMRPEALQHASGHFLYTLSAERKASCRREGADDSRAIRQERRRRR